LGHGLSPHRLTTAIEALLTAAWWALSRPDGAVPSIGTPGAFLLAEVDLSKASVAFRARRALRMAGNGQLSVSGKTNNGHVGSHDPA